MRKNISYNPWVLKIKLEKPNLNERLKYYIINNFFSVNLESYII